MKVKALSLTLPEFHVKRVPESRNRGRNVMSLQPPLQTQKSQGENPNLTGKVNVSQTWFRLRLCALQRDDLSSRRRPGSPETQPNPKKWSLKAGAGKASQESAEFGPGRVPHGGSEAEALQEPS